MFDRIIFYEIYIFIRHWFRAHHCACLVLFFLWFGLLMLALVIPASTEVQGSALLSHCSVQIEKLPLIQSMFHIKLHGITNHLSLCVSCLARDLIIKLKQNTKCVTCNNLIYAFKNIWAIRNYFFSSNVKTDLNELQMNICITLTKQEREEEISVRILYWWIKNMQNKDIISCI